MVTKKKEIYYVEDDENIAQTVSDFLGKHGYQVLIFATIADARNALQNRCPTLVLVDWNMPDGNGAVLCQWIRAKWKELPIIFLTVRGDSRDIVSGFGNGADDYVVKPFVLEVLLSRIGALLRRTGDASGQYLSCDAISLDQEKTQVFCGTEEIHLSPLEYQVLLCLLRNKGRTVTRQNLLENIWDIHGNYVNDNTLTVTMKRLREKLHQPGCLKTVRSVGYRMEETE
ncbi:MAG: response regulator transcription factor [Lachnospiraceae bacterium]|jgi:DNA-binding response OmpR family regulator|nr:response regulator transcription factor [Lachnospiraceae bacterium]